VTEHRFPDYGSEGLNLASRFIDMNVLSLDEDTVVVNALYPELIDTLEEEGLEVVPVRHRHRRLFSGGFHCFTLDCVRAGGAEDYLG
jgi:glycine amidinotransferase